MRIRTKYEIVVPDVIAWKNDDGVAAGWREMMVPLTPHLEAPPPSDDIEPLVLNGVAKATYGKRIPRYFPSYLRDNLVTYSSEIESGSRPTVRAVLRRVTELRIGKVVMDFPRDVEDYLFANPNASQ